MSKPIEFSVKFVLHTLVCKLATSQWTETHPYKMSNHILKNMYPRHPFIVCNTVLMGMRYLHSPFFNAVFRKQ
jgi:hypothetical protein